MILKSPKYSRIAALLCFTIVVGIGLPSGLHAMDLDHCESMEIPMDHSDSMHSNQQDEDCHDEMNRSDFSLACDCSMDLAPITTENFVLSHTSIKVSSSKFIIDLDFPSVQRLNSSDVVIEEFSPPPIFILQQVFRI